MIFLLLLLAIPANAEETKQDCAYARALYPTIAERSSSSYIENRDGVCRIFYTPKPGYTVDFEDRQAMVAAIEAELDAIEAKDEADIKLSDLKRALKLNAKLRKLRR